MQVRYSYLKDKFTQQVAYDIFDKMWRDVVSTGDFTLGKAVKEFEKKFAAVMGVKHAIGVANGTDALELSLWANGVRAGDEVIAPANTFVASLGAIGNLQAKPVLVDIGHDYVMNADNIEKAITEKTKAIMPVHFCGNPVDMDKVLSIANKHKLSVIEDACQAYLAEYKGKCVGSFGDCGAFSLHPLKILNVMGDGGMITTNSDMLYKELRLLQNHGLHDRDTITRFPCRNSRLDSIHAVVGDYQMSDVPGNVKKRRENAAFFDRKLKDCVSIIPRNQNFLSCYHLYFFEVDATIRDQLYNHLIFSGIDAKIHYKTPLYQQVGLEGLGYKKGDFPLSDYLCDRIITLPVDEHMTSYMKEHCVETIKRFMQTHKDIEKGKEICLSNQKPKEESFMN